MSFSQEASKNLKGRPCYPSKICKSLPEHLILPSILTGCMSLPSSRLYCRTRQYPVNEHLILSLCPTLYYPENLKFTGENTPQNTPQNTFFTEQLPVTAFKCHFLKCYFLLKGKNRNNFSYLL